MKEDRLSSCMAGDTVF